MLQLYNFIFFLSLNEQNAAEKPKRYIIEETMSGKKLVAGSRSKKKSRTVKNEIRKISALSFHIYQIEGTFFTAGI